MLPALAYLQILPGGRYPRLLTLQRFRDGVTRCVFQLFPPRGTIVEKKSTVQLPLGLRMLIENSFMINFNSPMHEDRPQLHFSPGTTGNDIRFISELSVSIYNTARNTHYIPIWMPVLEIETFSQSHLTPLRLCRKITSDWAWDSDSGKGRPKHEVIDELWHPFL
jgi:hypothetical protein